MGHCYRLSFMQSHLIKREPDSSGVLFLFCFPSHNDMNQNMLTFKFPFRLTTGIFILPAYDGLVYMSSTIIFLYMHGPSGAQKEAKWGLSLLHLFSANALDTLLSLLNKFYDVLLPVWSQRQSLSVSQASTLVSLATVCCDSCWGADRGRRLSV